MAQQHRINYPVIIIFTLMAKEKLENKEDTAKEQGRGRGEWDTQGITKFRGTYQR